MNLVAIVGTNNINSTNRKLLQFMQKHFSDKATIEILEISDFPAFNEPENRKLPEIMESFSDKIKKSDGVIISTPEYDHTITAALKSVLEWISYTTQVLMNKPVMITGASLGALGSSRAQVHLRQILNSPELKARVLPGTEFLLGYSGQAFDDTGDLLNKEKVQELEHVFEEFLLFTQITAQIMEQVPNRISNYKKFAWELNKGDQ
ncbi:NAD(P)H-dependent oxidoreductase [Aerococcaceae bacterium DSM 111020]|nr:NAD(P)H-dependent oxidoreductase [Aerococcaceae bacterium DSM 111020]